MLGKMMGLGGNPLYDAFDQRRNTLMGVGAGLLSGNWGNMGQYAMQGRQMDDAYATQQKAEATRQDQMNKTVQAMLEAGREDLANMAESGFMEEAWRGYLDHVKAQSGGGDETFFAPIQGTIGDDPTYLQFGNKGGVRQAEIPEGFTPQARYDKRDLGTVIRITDTVTGQTWDEPKENYQEAYDKSSGGAQGTIDVETAAHAPKAIANAEAMISNIDAVINDPNLEWAVGVGGLLPAIPNTPQAGTIARIEQLQGAAFLQAFETLKGGGQITEVEGKKATDAIARLNRAQSKEDFIRALEDLKSVIRVGLERAKQQAAGGAPAPVGDDIDSILGGYGL